jgi:CheY-like chemotaxis protein
MSVVFLTRDLVFSSRLAAVAERLGIVASTVTSLAAAAAQLSNGTVKLVVVDLSTGEVDVKEIVDRLREVSPGLAVVAFAPHVHEMRLKAAAEAGCNEVLTRGQFDRQMENIVVRYAAIEQQ